MDIRSFGTFLENTLIKRGVSENAAKQRVSSLLDSLTPEDVQELEAINSQEGLKDITEKFVTLLNENKKLPKPEPRDKTVKPAGPAKAAPQSAPQAQQPSQAAAPQQVKQPSGEIVITEKKPQAQQPSQTPAQAPQQQMQQTPPQGLSQPQKPAKPDPLDAYDISKQAEEPEPEPTEKGRTVFIVGALITLPITLFLLSVMLIAFGAVFLALAAVSLAIIVAMIALIAAGSILAVVGIIYGFTQLFSSVPVGLYEIGLGVLIIGIVFLVSILLYNIALRFIPWVMKKVVVLFRFVCRQLKRLFYYVRKECYKL